MAESNASAALDAAYANFHAAIFPSLDKKGLAPDSDRFNHEQGVFYNLNVLCCVVLEFCVVLHYKIFPWRSQRSSSTYLLSTFRGSTY
jgi:hypothetical protein